MKDKMQTFEVDLAIDENRLDDEWVDQPSLYFKWAAKLADARRDLEAFKSAMDIVKAEFYLNVRKNPEEFELTKPSEKTIESTVIGQPDYKSGQELIIQAKHKVDVIQAAVTSMDHRRKALEGLVSLYLANYFSNPKAPKGSEDRMDEIEKKSVRRRGKRTRE